MSGRGRKRAKSVSLSRRSRKSTKEKKEVCHIHSGCDANFEYINANVLGLLMGHQHNLSKFCINTVLADSVCL